jgi:hypothetical protein
LPPLRVTAVMIALEAFSYSALKFCVSTWNSCTAFCGNGEPRLASCPTTPPRIRSFLKLTPSMKTLVCDEGSAPEVTSLRNSLSATRTPGASAAKLRKLRLFCGRYCSCSCVTLVATSLVRMSLNRSLTTWTVSL